MITLTHALWALVVGVAGTVWAITMLWLESEETI